MRYRPVPRKARGNEMKHLTSIALACLSLLLGIPSFVLASENCSMLGGTCRDTCAPNEAVASGAFDDCGKKQECCVVHDAAKDAVRCCIYSFDSRNFGPNNCGLPENNVCPKGAGSPAPCAKLALCRERP